MSACVSSESMNEESNGAISSEGGQGPPCRRQPAPPVVCARRVHQVRPKSPVGRTARIAAIGAKRVK